MKKFFLATTLITIAGCSLIGLHFNIHNPRRAGKYPKKTEALQLFGNQDSKYRTCYDVKYYGLDVTFGGNLLKENNIETTVQMDFVATKDFDTIQTDLAPVMKLESIYFTSDTKAKEPVFFRKHQALMLIFHGEKGKKYSITMVAAGTPLEAKRPPWSGGFVRKQDDLKNPWWGVCDETEGASIWFPCKDVVNDEPDSVDMYYKVPEPLVAVGNGNLIGKKQLGGCCNLDEYHWHVSYPINLYDITFYIGKFKLLHDVYVSPVTHDSLQLNHYVLEQHYDKAKKQFEQLKDYLAFYEQTYGPYPWYRDGFKLVESPYEGMEHQTAIAYGNGFATDPTYKFDYIILHETAHEWWGNSVTAEDLADGWIHEGFATYTEALWVEHKFGHGAYVNYMLNYRIEIINRRPVVAPYNIRYFDYHDEDMYTKGAWALYTLRNTIGDSVFFDVLKTFYARYAYRNARTEDLEKIVNEKTGEDYHWFFQQYLHDRFTPELEYCVWEGNFFYRWGKTDSSFVLPVKVKFNDTEKTGYELRPTKYLQRLEIPLDATYPFFNDDQLLFKPVENKNLRTMMKWRT
ncbi:MAG: M1 family metallopeptidase [Bacteroidetes bacterium]|nr:M1 family metallopeptidase [Bacteroidota bacterium]